MEFPIVTSPPNASDPVVYLDADLLGGTSLIAPATLPPAIKLPPGHSRALVTLVYTRKAGADGAGVGVLRGTMYYGNGVSPMMTTNPNGSPPIEVGDAVREAGGSQCFHLDLSYGERVFGVLFEEDTPAAGFEGHVKVDISTR